MRRRECLRAMSLEKRERGAREGGKTERRIDEEKRRERVDKGNWKIYR